MRSVLILLLYIAVVVGVMLGARAYLLDGI